MATPGEESDAAVSKLRGRMKHGDKASVVRAVQACRGVWTDAEVIAAVVEALGFHDVDVRENAAHVLADVGDITALAPLLAAAGRAPDREERLTHERAYATLKSRLSD